MKTHCCHHHHGPGDQPEKGQGQAAASRHAPDLVDGLRRGSRRLTGPRQAILQVLQQQAHPVSRKEVFAALRPGQCDLATVYRSLNLLEEMGLVRRYDFGDGVARFEVMRNDPAGHHHHLVCTCCAAVVEILDCRAYDWEERIARESGFQRVTHRLEFFGLCPDCQEEKRTAGAPTKRAALSRGPSGSGV